MLRHVLHVQWWMPTGSARRPCTDVLWRSSRIRSLWTCFYVSISDAMRRFHWLKEARVARLLSSFPRWEWIPIMFHRLQRRPGVQFYQLRRNTSSPNLQLTSQDRFHFSYQRSEGDLRGERRLGALVLIPDRANIWHLSRFNHGIFWMIQPGVHICVFAEFIVYSLNTYGRLMTNSKMSSLAIFRSECWRHSGVMRFAHTVLIFRSQLHWSPGCSVILHVGKYPTTVTWCYSASPLVPSCS